MDLTLNATIQEIVKEWTTGLANLTFVFREDANRTPANSADIRVTIRDKKSEEKKNTKPGHWLFVGTDRGRSYSGRDIPVTEPTMKLDLTSLQQDEMKEGTYGYSTVLHEFGHAIGLKHEHLRPDRSIRFKDQAAYTYYLSEEKWSKDAMNSAVLTLMKDMVGSEVRDPNSVMMY